MQVSDVSRARFYARLPLTATRLLREQWSLDAAVARFEAIADKAREAHSALDLAILPDDGLGRTLRHVQALLGGSADVVSGFYDHTIQMAADGRELVAFVTMLRFPGLVLVTSPQSAGTVTTIEKLKGHIAGVTTAG